MTLFKVALIGVCAVLLALGIKPFRGEYALFLSLGAGVLIFVYILGQMSSIIDVIQNIRSMVSINGAYVQILLKVIGVAYICEFAAALCKDAGFSSVASQIEMAGKLTILVMSMPVLLSLLETIGSFLK